MKLSLRQKQWIMGGLICLASVSVVLLIAFDSIYADLFLIGSVTAAFLFRVIWWRCPECGKWLGHDKGTYCSHCGREIDYDAK